MKANKYKINLQLAYFNEGMGKLNYVKYLLIFFGVASLDVKWTLIFGIIWGISCYMFGRWWFRKGWKESEVEVTNKINPFVKEMRKVYK